MSISFGPKLNLLYNALIGESYFDSLRVFLQSLDAIVQGSVINATQVSPPTSPNPGDAYLLIGGTPGGAWTGQAGNIAVWDAQLTSSGTNNVVPGWIFLVPKAGWIIWNVALGSLLVFNGSSWNPATGGANFPTNTDITSMTGIPSTTIGSAGYAYNDGTDPQTSIGASGLTFGAGTYGTSGQLVQVAEQTWSGFGVTDFGIGVYNASAPGASVMTSTLIATSGSVNCNVLNSLGVSNLEGDVFVGSGAANSAGSIAARGSSNNSLAIGGASVTGLISVLIQSNSGGPTAGVGLLGFATDYPTQTTVGAAGGASALPATPTGYLQVAIHGAQFVIPYYAHA